MKKKIIIAVAPVSASDTNLDINKISEDVALCYENGATMVHLHSRETSGKLTADLTEIQKTLDLIEGKCPIIKEVSTGGVSNLTIEERTTPCTIKNIEFNSLNVGSTNLGEHVYQNPIKDVKYCVKQIKNNQKAPDIEVFEIGMIHTSSKLIKEFNLTKPLLFSVVLGHEGEMPATSFALDIMKQSLDHYFNRDEYIFGYTEAHREDFELVLEAVEKGAEVIRIGFEDSYMIDKNTKATYNYEIVKALRETLENNGYEVADITYARKRLLGE